MKIVVIGGSGLIGTKLVDRLRGLGHEAVAASPRSGVNAVTGEGLEKALAGAAVVIDVSNSPAWGDAEVLAFFRTSTVNLLAEETRAGVGHHVALSIVGTHRQPDIGYFRAKAAQETLIRESPVPYSIVQATQFFEFVRGIADASTAGNIVRVPAALIQPIAADDVAAALERVVLGGPLNGTLELGGPEAFSFEALLRLSLAAGDDPREVVTDPEGRYFGGLLAERALIPGEGGQLSQMRFADWLGTQPRGRSLLD